MYRGCLECQIAWWELHNEQGSVDKEGKIHLGRRLVYGISRDAGGIGKVHHKVPLVFGQWLHLFAQGNRTRERPETWAWFHQGRVPRWLANKPFCECQCLEGVWNRRVLTFIRAFESSPVHCVNPRPSGKRRRPEKDGTTAMLISISSN